MIFQKKCRFDNSKPAIFSIYSCLTSQEQVRLSSFVIFVRIEYYSQIDYQNKNVQSIVIFGHNSRGKIFQLWCHAQKQLCYKVTCIKVSFVNETNYCFFFRERAESLFGCEQGCRDHMRKVGVNRAAKRSHAKKAV